MVSPHAGYLVSSLLLLLASGCGGSSATASIMVAITSEAPVPEGIDTVEVSVQRGGIERFYNIYTRDNTGQRLLPGTLAIDRPDNDPSQDPITVVVTAKRGGEARALRRATVSFVEQEQRLLRMPVKLACMQDDLLACPDGQTCRSGVCEADSVDLQAQPRYDPRYVFSDQAESCYDPTTCDAASRIWIPAEALKASLGSGCALSAVFPGDVPRTDVNMEFVWRADPRNVADSPTLSAVTVDYDAVEGWSFDAKDPRRVVLVPGVCEAIKTGRVLGTFEVFGCQPKNPLLPRCSETALAASVP